MHPLPAFREAFRDVWSRGVVYLNHAALSPRPRPVVRALLGEVGVDRTGQADRAEAWIEEVRGLGARILGVVDPRDVALIPNTATGIGMVAAAYPWRPGDNVVLAACEYPANAYPWYAQRRRGVEVRILESPLGPTLEAVAAAVDERTRVVAVSHVQFTSGFRADLAALGAFCRERGIHLVVDAIQSLGVLPVEAEAWGLAAVAAGGPKWLLAPFGVGLLYVERDLARQLQPPFWGPTSVEDFWRLLPHRPEELWPDARRLEPGTQNWLGIVGLRAALTLLLETGIDRIAAQALDLADRIREGGRALGLEVFGPVEGPHRSPIVCLVHPRAEAVVTVLEERGIVVSARKGLDGTPLIRVSPHGWNSREEVERFLEALAKAL